MRRNERLSFEDLFDARRNEIEETIIFLQMLDYSMHQSDENGKTKYDQAFEPEVIVTENGTADTLPQRADSTIVSNTIKASVYIMIYNLVEYTVSSLLLAIYDKIKEESCSAQDICVDIRKIWHHSRMLSVLKEVHTTKRQTIEDASWKLLDDAIERKTIELDSRNTISGGNLDGIQIKTTMEKHGVHITNLQATYRPDKLEEIKNKRNDLAHGACSFSEAGSQVTISDLIDLHRVTTAFLTQLISDVKQYISSKKYLK